MTIMKMRGRRNWAKSRCWPVTKECSVSPTAASDTTHMQMSLKEEVEVFIVNELRKV
jgi:hypothetical protein